MSTSIVNLSRLENVPLREAWPDEATNFTPWLAEEQNLALLGEALGLALALEAKEKPVGAFAADILARDATSESWVLIENQLTPTDHRHLGQLLTYAAGLDARTVVWVAEAFREEHRAAIDFLNRATIGGYSFFAVQIELYRIGDSPLAPRFSVVSKPNDWNKKAQLAKNSLAEVPNETQLQYQEYWMALIAAAANRYPALAARNAWKQNVQRIENLRGGDPALLLDAVFAWDKGLRLNIYIDGILAKAAFRQLSESREKIEQAFGNELLWEELPEARASRISFYMPGNEKRENKARWPAQHEWILTWAPKLAEAVRPFATALSAEQLQQHPEELCMTTRPRLYSRHPRRVTPRTWTIRDAQRHLLAVIQSAQRFGPQRVRIGGKDVAFVLSASDFLRLKSMRRRSSLHELLSDSPLRDLEFEHESYRFPVRDFWEPMPDLIDCIDAEPYSPES